MKRTNHPPIPTRQLSFTHPPPTNDHPTSLIPKTLLRSLALTPSSASLWGHDDSSLAIASVERARERTRSVNTTAGIKRNRSTSAITPLGASLWSWEFLDACHENEDGENRRLIGANSTHHCDVEDNNRATPHSISANAPNCDKPTPLPTSIIFVLCVIIFSEPMSMTIRK